MENSFIVKSYWWERAGSYVVGDPCDNCVSPSPKNWVLGLFTLGLNLGSGLRACWDRGLGLGLELDKNMILWEWRFTWQISAHSLGSPKLHRRNCWHRQTPNTLLILVFFCSTRSWGHLPSNIEADLYWKFLPGGKIEWNIQILLECFFLTATALLLQNMMMEDSNWQMSHSITTFLTIQLQVRGTIKSLITALALYYISPSVKNEIFIQSY